MRVDLLRIDAAPDDGRLRNRLAEIDQREGAKCIHSDEQHDAYDRVDCPDEDDLGFQEDLDQMGDPDREQRQ